jgi:hypothetical protein
VRSPLRKIGLGLLGVSLLLAVPVAEGPPDDLGHRS